jgi:hypothetical protein
MRFRRRAATAGWVSERILYARRREHAGRAAQRRRNPNGNLSVFFPAFCAVASVSTDSVLTLSWNVQGSIGHENARGVRCFSLQLI